MNKALVLFPWIESDAAIKTVKKQQKSSSIANLNGLMCFFDALQVSSRSVLVI